MLSKTTALLGAALCATVAAESRSLADSYSPAMLWSDLPTFTAQQSYMSAVWGVEETAETIKNVVLRHVDSNAFTVLSQPPTETAEALCLFVLDNLVSTQLADFGATSYVQSAIKTSKSSVVALHTTRATALTDALKDARVVPIDGFQAWLQSKEGAAVLSNNQPDLVVITLPKSLSPAEADTEIEKAVTALKQVTTRVDFGLTGNQAVPVMGARRRRLASGTSSTTDIICDVGYLVGMSASGKAFCFSHYVRMTPEILTALLFGFFFLFLAYVGLSVLHAIQTPLRYPHNGPPKGKEF